MKFNRGYVLLIKTNRDELIRIDPDSKMLNEKGKASTGLLSIHFTVTRDVSSSVNGCKIEIYNLSKDNRNRLQKDKFKVDEYWQVILSAGYDGLFHQLFKGNVREAWSEKTGTDYITHLDCYDGEYAIKNSYFSEPVNKNQNILETISGMVKSSNLDIGFRSDAAKTQSVRGQVLEGNIADVMDQACPGLDVYIDNEEVNILGPGDIRNDVVYKLAADQLLSSPKKRDMKIELETLFFPEINLGRMVEVQSKTQQYNGQYLVIGIEHDVTISGAEAGNATSKITAIVPIIKNTPPSTETETAGEAEHPHRLYKVVSGDNFRKIAGKMYEDESKWNVIVKANPQVNSRPPAVDGLPTIYAGDELIIPELP